MVIFLCFGLPSSHYAVSNENMLLLGHQLIWVVLYCTVFCLQRRHSHGDQTYIDMEELLPPPWGQLIFWHGRCKEGRPTLCVLLGKAVRQLPQHELKDFIAVTGEPSLSFIHYASVVNCVQ